MLGHFILTIGGGIFLLLLISSYFSKKHSTKRLRSYIYRFLIIVNLFLVILEIGVGVCFQYDVSYSITHLVLRFRYIFDILYFSLIYLFYFAYIRDLKYENIKEMVKHSLECKLYLVFSTISFIIYMFLPFKDMTKDNFTFLAGPAFYFIVFFSVSTVFLTILTALLKRELISSRNRLALVFLFSIMVFILIFQSLFPSTAILGISGVIHMFCLYFISENPDLEFIDEIGNLKVEVERANKTKSDFLSNMSHEIRTPMNAIVGFSETILNDTTFNKESVINDIRHIEASSRNLIDIIKNILDVSKIESGKDTLEDKEYSLGKILMELDSIIQSRIEAKHIKLLMTVDREIPSKLRGDPTKVFQVLLNILTNAVKYTEVGKIKLVVTKNIEKDKVRLNFRISDTGFGIKKEDYDKMFEKFSRLDMATTNEIEGTGLGLVITKRYVDLMGGKIWFESEYGVGTTFYVELVQPIVDASPLGDIVEPKNEEAKEKTYLDCSSYNILIVDDNKLNLKVASRLLGAYKFNIDTANGGSECVYKFKEGNHYDMIFLDHMMPEMDGIEVLHIIKKLDGYFVPPMVALTANAITGVREMYLKEGFDEYLSKPIDTNELNRLILKYFDKK